MMKEIVVLKLKAMTERLNHLQFKLFGFARRHIKFYHWLLLCVCVLTQKDLLVFLFLLLFAFAFIAKKALQFPLFSTFRVCSNAKNLWNCLCLLFFLLAGVSETDWQKFFSRAFVACSLDININGGLK